MDLDRSLLKEFAKVVNDVGDKPQPNQYVYGTVTTGAGNTKCVMLDGSDTMTPISEVVNAEAGDRVLVSVNNHQATVVGNITFPPSARKEQQAIDSANGALEQSNQAMEKAKDAQTKASSAITDSSVASALANEAKTESAKAQEAANTAIQNAGEAKQLAQASNNKAGETQQLANQVKDSVAAANEDIGKLKVEVKTANDNIASTNTKLEEQAGEITTIKETYSTKVETETTKADLTTEISKKVGELQTSVEKNFVTKTENVTLEQKLQTQITQNAGDISSTVTKVEKLQSDTTEQQKNIDKALSDAQAANTAAGVAKGEAEKAKTAADAAQQAADTATAKAESATTAAGLAEQKVTEADKQLQQAKTDLAEAQKNLETVTSRVDATEQEIVDAKEKVDTANANVTKALTDVAEAKNAASKADEAASKAQGEATAANKAASDAQTKAADAQKVATNAQQAADKAQSDLAALTSRVTTAETKITQNNEAITAQASRITETSNKVDGIQNDIANNYYSKEQTDAQIQLKADGITQQVTEVTKTVTSANKNASDALNKANNLTDRANSGEFDGRGVASTTVEYQASTSGTDVPTGTWVKDIPTVAAGSYLWTKTTTNYTSGDPTIGYSVARMGVNGAKGDKGDTGETGATGIRGSITYTSVYECSPEQSGLYFSDLTPKVSADNPPLIGDLSIAPSGKMYVITSVNTTGDSKTGGGTYSIGKLQADIKGPQGVKGNDGKGIKSTEVTYQIWANGTSTPTGTWSSTPPNTTADKSYLWTRTVITYTDNAQSTSYSVGSTPEGIVVGGRNLLRHSSMIGEQLLCYNITYMNDVTSVNYESNGFHLVTPSSGNENNGIGFHFTGFTTLAQSGDTITFSFDVKGTDDGNASFTNILMPANTDAWWTGIKSSNSFFTPTSEFKRVSVTFTIPTDANTFKHHDIYLAIHGNLQSDLYIKNLKLEKGNKATDWTPAPEDQEQYVNDKIAASEKTTETNYTSAIEQKAKGIELRVDQTAQSIDKTNATIKSINNTVDLNTKGLGIVQSRYEQIQNALDGTMSKTEVQEWARFDGANLELGASNQPFKCRLSTTELAFYQSQNKVAWISNNELHVLRAIIAESIGCGSFRFVDEGDLGFSLI